jgi:hypothetical protein
MLNSSHASIYVIGILPDGRLAIMMGAADSSVGARIRSLLGARGLTIGAPSTALKKALEYCIECAVTVYLWYSKGQHFPHYQTGSEGECYLC